MSIEKEFVPYQQSLELKELGFDEPCFMQYYKSDLVENIFGQFKNSYFNLDEQVSAPTYSQAFRFFREKYELDSMVQPTYSTKYQFRVFNVEIKCKVQIYGDYMGKEFDTYEEAELASIIKLIKIVKQQKM
jgi:hypothetical protein